MSADEMISLEEARKLVLDAVHPMPFEVVSLLDAVGRVSAECVRSDIDVSPFAHSAMDGFGLRAAQLEGASEDAPVTLRVVANIGAGSVFNGEIADDECVRIMTGAELPEGCDSVVKYEIVDALGDGMTGSHVVFKAPTPLGSNVRQAGEDARKGDSVVEVGEVIHPAGAGFLASCGAVSISTYARPRVGIIATGSELTPATEVPERGHIRDSNSYAMAACVKMAGGIPEVLPICKDTYEALSEELEAATHRFDFVITTGGAANGDFDFIKRVVADKGQLLMSQVNLRPGKAQTFGIVNGKPVFGLPGNPAAAYCGFEMLIRPALRKMQGYSHFEHPSVKARLTRDYKKKDPRRILLRSTLVRNAETGELEVTPAKNQSSGLFSAIQKSNCLAVMPEGTESRAEGSIVECILLDVPEEVVL